MGVQGSSYRREGARLLISSGGAYAGSISGGCLEAEVIRKATWTVRNGALIERYSTMFDDTAEMPYGLGCGGAVDLLLEPAGTPEFLALMEALRSSLAGEPRRVLTELPAMGKTMRRWVLDGSGASVFSSSAEEALPASTSHVFDEWLQAPQRLLLLGAGDDAQPMTRMAALLGWSVVLADGRAQWARRERFPEAERIAVAESLEGLAPLEIGSDDAVVLMSHSYEQDRRWLAQVLPHRPRYLGLLGSRHRSALLVSEAAALLGWPLERACAGLFAPVGLDIGGDGAEAIALAVLAEIQACMEGKLGHSRRMTPDLVEEQIARGGASPYLQAQCAV